MLKTRIITALVILPIVFVALFVFPNWAWDIFTLGIALVSCWEWSRFCQFPIGGQRLYLGFSCAVAAVIFVAYLCPDLLNFALLAQAAFVLSALFWLLVAPWWLARMWRPQGAHAFRVAGVTGWVVIFPTWLALLSLHDVSPWLLLSFAMIVWVADIAAYFVGKAVGRRKLAPGISPGKTIEGVIGAMVGVALYFFLWRAYAGDSFGRGEGWVRELQSHGLWLFAFFLLLAVLSVTGDLFESWMKRGAGMKDSSGLLPGHGGMLDRIDALTSTLPLAGLYVMLMRVAS